MLRSLSDPNARLRLALYLGAVAIMGLFIMATLIPLSSNPGFCGRSCHRLNPEFRTWQKSSHANVPCYACHSNPSIINVLQDKLIAGPLHVVGTVVGEQAEPINPRSAYSQKSVPSERCLRCHSEENRTFTSRKGLNVTSKMHVKHLNNGLDCTTCHNRITHLNAEDYEPLKTSKPGFKYKNFMTMRQGCWRCHSKDVNYRSGATLKVVTGKKPPTRCGLCHNREWNLKPTVGEYNHNDVAGVPWRDGKRRHGYVAKRDFSICLGCHQAEQTDDGGIVQLNCTTTCHRGVKMPHNIPEWSKYYENDKETPLWLRAHPYMADLFGIRETADFGESDPEFVCSMCHNQDREQANFCQKCHHRSFDRSNSSANAPWKTQHPSVVKKIGSSGCQKCHLLEFCAYCHTNGTKPARGLFLNRSWQSVSTKGK